jgi:Peptidase family M23
MRQVLTVALFASATLVAGSPQLARAPGVVRVSTAPFVVTGSDGQRHLAYELQLTGEFATTEVRLERVDVFRDNDTKPLVSFGGTTLDGRVMRPGADPKVRYERLLRGDIAAVVHLWVTLPDGAVPARLRHRLTLLADGDAEVAVPETHTDVQSVTPLVLGAPLRGGRWLAHNGPGNHRSAHWGSVLIVGGRATIPQRFAIDFIGLDTSGRAVKGDFQKSSNTDWIGFGAEILAVADGIIREARDGIQDVPPLAENLPPSEPTLPAVAGNYIVLELAANRFVHYVHLKQGSVAVSVGQRVRRGEVLGRLGNSGNTNAPHLHFNLVDAASLEGYEGLPFVFDSFDLFGETSAGRAVGADSSPKQTPSPPSRRVRQIPLDGAVVRF